MGSANQQYGFNVTLEDLNFILKQIKLAEASVDVNGKMHNLPDLVGNPLLPYGLRTVDGSWNNLLPGQHLSGAADQPMPRLIPADYQTAEPVPIYFGGKLGDPATSYAQTAPGNVVFDSFKEFLICLCLVPMIFY